MSVETVLKIGENIKKLREFRGYSQDYMAKELNISQKTYSNIEADKGKINKNQIEHIAELLEVDPIHLLTYDDKVIFNNENCAQAGMFNTHNTNTYNATSEVEKELYDKRIEELKERVAELKEEVVFLRSIVKEHVPNK